MPLVLGAYLGSVNEQPGKSMCLDRPSVSFNLSNTSPAIRDGVATELSAINSAREKSTSRKRKFDNCAFFSKLQFEIYIIQIH